MLLIHAREDVIFVDTMNLDGETNLKPKTIASKEIHRFIQEEMISESVGDLEEHLQHHEASNTKYENKYSENLSQLTGTIECDRASENLEKWDGTVVLNELPEDKKKAYCDIDNLLLRGCYLRNINYIHGIAVYLGRESKIMMNAKKPPHKVSNLMKMMNYMLYSVFAVQF